MMKHAKKWLGLLTTACCLAFGTNAAWAATETVDGVTWTYTVSGGKASVGSGNWGPPAVATTTSGAIAIPAKLGGYPVTSIGTQAFGGCNGLTNVTIPNAVTNIGNYAFYGCSGLTSVTIPNGVKYIGDCVFYNCSGLTSVTIPNSVTSIGSSVFSGCNGLTAIEVADGNSKYESADGVLFDKGKKTLLQYPRGKSGAYAIPNSVTTIESSAFYGCTNLTSVTIPDSVEDIWWGAFSGCSGLAAIEVADGNTHYESADGVLFYKGKKTLRQYPGGKSGAYYAIPNSVTNIWDSAFEGCSGLTSVTIPNSVTSIGSSAFEGCSGLTSVTIPDSVTSIGWEAFKGCIELTSVTIPNNVTSIESSTFDGCSGLENVTIGNGVTSIGNYAFYYCTNLTSVTIPDSVTNIGSSAFEGCNSLWLLYAPAAWKGTSKLADAGVPATCTVWYGDPDPNLSLTPVSREFGPGMGGGAILTSGSGTWEAVATEAWITLNETTGEVGYPVVYTVAATTEAEARTGYVFVNGHLHTVVQAGLGGTLAPESAEFEWEGGEASIAVTVGEGVRWQAKADDPWLSVAPAGGTGNGTVACTVAAFDEVATRQGTLTVAGQTFAVFQYGRRMKLASTQTEQDYHAHALSVSVDAMSGTEWAVSSGADWIAVTDAGSGLGSGSVRLSIEENPSWKARTGAVAIGTETFTVTQQGRTALDFSLSPETATAPVAGANGVLAVAATPDLPWSVASQAAWIAVYSQTASGAGNGTIVYAVSPNPTLDERTGTIAVTPGDANVAAKSLAVTQAAAASSVSPGGYEFAAEGESCTVEVSVPDFVEWQVENTNAWLAVAGSANRTGPGTVSLQADPNNTVYPRSGTVTIARKTFAVSQAARGVEVEYETKLFGADGGFATLAIRPYGNVSWTAVSSDPTWITIFQGDSGTGDGEISYVVSPYMGTGGARTGTIAVGGKTVYISQRTYELAIDPAEAWVAGNAGTGGFAVSAGFGNEWEAIAAEPWISLEEGCGSGMGDGTVRFLYGDNDTGKERTGRIVVAGEVFTLHQRVRQTDPFPEAADETEVAEILAGAADARLAEHIAGVAEYDGFRAWMDGNGLDHQTVKDSAHAWPSYLLGAATLLANEPAIALGGLTVGEGGAMSVGATVRDGGEPVAVDAGKLAAMFSGTGDLSGWEGGAELELAVTPKGAEGDTLLFEVVPDGGMPEKAFLRIAE